MYEKDKSKVAKAEKNIIDMVKEDNTYIENYKNSPMTDDETKLWAEFNDNTVKYRENRDKVIEAAKANNFEEAQKQYVEMVPMQTSMMDSLDKVIEINLSQAKIANQNIYSIYTKCKYNYLYIDFYRFYNCNFNWIVYVKKYKYTIKKDKRLCGKISVI